MKLLITQMLAVCLTVQCFSQVITGSWVLIQARRIDGSRIVQRGGLDSYFEYTFSEKSIVQVDSAKYTQSVSLNHLSFINPKLATSDYSDFELISDTILVVTQKHTPEQADKMNRFVFLRQDRYFEYIKTTSWFQLEDDSTLVANSMLFPRLDFQKSQYHFMAYFRKSIPGFTSLKGEVTGFFTVDKHGNVVDAKQVENRGFPYWSEFVKALDATNGQWYLPLKGYRYKVAFTIGPVELGTDIDIVYRLNAFDRFKVDDLGPYGRELTLIQSTYERGVALGQRGQYEKAINAFTKVISMDKLFLDAYYNRAASYYQLKQLDNACIDWKYLKDLEQVTAITLYEINCKK